MLSVDLKERIVKWYFEDGLTYRDIRDQVRVSLGLISNTIQNFQEFSVVMCWLGLEATGHAWLGLAQARPGQAKCLAWAGSWLRLGFL